MMPLPTIVFSGQSWILPAIGLLLILAGALVWAGHRSATDRWVRIGCGVLKGTGILALALCLLEPLWVSQRATPGANFIAILADNSQGLQIRDPGSNESRGELMRRELAGDPKTWRLALEETFQVRRYTFDSRLQSTRDFSDMDFSGRSSAIGNALRTGAGHWHGQPVAGVLLFTDGNATDIHGELPDLEGCPPVYPVIMGRDLDIKDLSLRKVGVSQTSFEDAPVTVQTDISAHGFGGAEVVTRLTQIAVTSTLSNQFGFRTSTGSNAIAEAIQRVPARDNNVSFRFHVQPDQPGIHFYELETRLRDELNSPDSQEATLVNNRQIVIADRGQEPFRVLYVGGRPNWEYKFLNRALQEDEQVRLVSLIRVARREPRFEFKGRAGESSNPLYRGFGNTDEETARYDQPVLIRLNTRDEFELQGGFPKTSEELFAYHAVIIDDTEAEFFTRDQMTLMQRFVSERGGGFLMLGGVDTFREGNYADTPVAAMLPVYLDRPDEPLESEKWKLSLTPEGWLQPWTRLRSTEHEERTRLERMPEFTVLNPTRSVKPGASILATATTADGSNRPALVAQRFGYGRSAALLIGDLWHWGLQNPEAQKDVGKAWRQLVRWLVSDVPSRVSVASAPAPEGDPGEVRLTVKARDEEFKPLDNATVRLVVRPVRMMSDDGNRQADGTPDSVQLTAEPSTEPGSYTATFIARSAGAYSVEASVLQADGKIAGQAAAGWTSDPAADEFRSLKPNRALLQSIAQRTGGRVLSMEDLERFVRQLPEERAPVMETRSEPLWHRSWVFLFVLGCFVTEWGIRRWKGLP